MKLSPIRRQDMLAAAEEFDAIPDSRWSEYWILVTEKGKEYPFKQLVRRAYELATGTQIDPGFFQSNDGYRKYIEKKFQYPVSFRVRENIPFFSAEDLEFFHDTAGQPYNSEDKADRAKGEQLRKTIFAKTNTWARALNLDGYEIKLDNNWQTWAKFTKYSWARICRTSDMDKKIFFTVGVSGEEEEAVLVYKLDCHYTSQNPANALRPEQSYVFKRMVKDSGAEWNEISAGDLEDYSWERLIEETRKFILHYTPLYEEVIEAVWNGEGTPAPKADSLNEQPVPPGIGQLPVRVKPFGFGYGDSPDYDAENKERKSIGDAGEALVIEWEKTRLINAGRPDLASAVSKQPDWKGYDILSFSPEGDPRYIEVKTTTGTARRPFYWSRNEKQTMLAAPKAFCLYRLYHFDPDANTAFFFKLEGDIMDKILEEPLQFLVYLK